MTPTRDHGGGLDAAVARFGGTRADWVDLSTGINPVPYPIPDLSTDAWTALPDQAAMERLLTAARAFWSVPDGVDIIAAPGASALIAQIPRLARAGRVCIPAPTYNEHAAAFDMNGWELVTDQPASADVRVHPNNPDGTVWSTDDLQADLRIIDESFCDVMPEASLIGHSTRPGTLILKSFGKFWGLAGLRLGFAIGDAQLIAQLRDHLGPWAVSGVAMEVGAQALEDTVWADRTRARLIVDAARLDTLFTAKGAELLGGTTLFRLYRVDDAAAWQSRLAQGHVWSRIFPYASDWIRIGLPAPRAWSQLEAAL